jgi:uncharacterized repeat protein (TIGR02543 family)
MKKLLFTRKTLAAVLALVLVLALAPLGAPNAKAVDELEITFGVSAVRNGNNATYRLTNVTITGGDSGNVGTFNITLPDELELQAHSLPGTGWTETTSGDNISILGVNASGTPTSITKAAAKTYLESLTFALSTDSVFPANGATIAVNVMETVTSQFVDSAGKVHFYEYVSGNRNWLVAFNDAKDRTYAGYDGYLATVTSIEEQMFIYNSIAKVVGWLGGTRVRLGVKGVGTGRITDESVLVTTIGSPTVYEGGREEYDALYNEDTTQASDWYWACGPEDGTVFYATATMSSTGTNGNFNFFSNTNTSALYPEQQTNINESTEPNNQTQQEVYLEFAQNGFASWNDYKITTNMGFYVEYGGTESLLDFIAKNGSSYAAAVTPRVVVEFNKNGGGITNIVETRTLFSGSAVGALPEVGNYTGYDGDGKWYTSATKGSGTEVTAATTFSANTPVYAQWEIQHFNVIYHPKTSQVYANVPLDYGANVTDPGDPSPLPTGASKFEGWALLDGTAWTFATDEVQDGANAARELHLYAQYDPAVFTVIFDDNYDGGAVDDSRTGTYLEAVPAKATPTRSGYTFAGWFEDADGLTAATLPTMFGGDEHFYAKWTANSAGPGVDFPSTTATPSPTPSAEPTPSETPVETPTTTPVETPLETPEITPTLPSEAPAPTSAPAPEDEIPSVAPSAAPDDGTGNAVNTGDSGIAPWFALLAVGITAVATVAKRRRAK